MYEIDTNRPHRRYHYDSERRLTRVEFTDGSEASYQYDAFGRRIKKTLKGKYGAQKHTEFIWEGDTLIAERSDARGYRSYVYEPNSFRPLALFEGEGAESKVYYYHLDASGTPIDVTDAQGNGVWSARYHAYGELLDNRINDLPNPFVFRANTLMML